jgi:hypothetical protein
LQGRESGRRRGDVGDRRDNGGRGSCGVVHLDVLRHGGVGVGGEERFVRREGGTGARRVKTGSECSCGEMREEVREGVSKAVDFSQET